MKRLKAKRWTCNEVAIVSSASKYYVDSVIYDMNLGEAREMLKSAFVCLHGF